MFKYLESVDVDDSKDVKSGYSITLNFSENPYFEDRKLTKSYAFADDGTTTINATSIKWKEGMKLMGMPLRRKEASAHWLKKVSSPGSLIQSTRALLTGCKMRWQRSSKKICGRTH
ncbi:unnamed protein product [Triticum turgidum subsp. durum]|uniref:Uncharacterized protein n=1 Tax=Triticum turgidum subsp. durum TaxID=4567 RepID=A0A9R0Y1G6_TRITD|nr:unnamed protein product [Triticum turgidum subsp. durum]